MYIKVMTQYLEDYSDSGDKPYWKFKGGDVYVAHCPDVREDLAMFIKALNEHIPDINLHSSCEYIREISMHDTLGEITKFMEPHDFDRLITVTWVSDFGLQCEQDVMEWVDADSYSIVANRKWQQRRGIRQHYQRVAVAEDAA